MLAVNDVTNKVYVTNTYSDMVTVIDGATNTTHALKAGSADGIAIDPRNNTIFLMTYEDPNVRVIDGATGTITQGGGGNASVGNDSRSLNEYAVPGAYGNRQSSRDERKDPRGAHHSGGRHSLCCCGESADSSDHTW